MKRYTVLAAIVIGLLGVVGSAAGGTPDGAAGPWADSVVAVNQGFAINGGFLPGRSDPTAALGPAESPPGDDNPIPNGTFYSLGFNGSLTLGFDNPICNQPGADLAVEVRETTKEPYPPESAQVYVSEDGINFVLAGTVTKDASVAMPAGITVAKFVRLVDVSDAARYAGHANADGFDVDGVQALGSSCPQGKIEICKAAGNGMTNRPFQFSLNGGTPFTVRGGRCSGPISTTAGLNTVEELESNPATDVSAITLRPSGRLISQDLANRRVSVKVVPGSTAATESRVTFTNQPAGGNFGDLKICKLSETPSYWGRQFSFRVNGGPLISIEANPAFDPPSSWSCRLAGRFRVGTKVTVQEQIPAGTEIAFIDSDPADRLLDFDTNAGTALVEIGAGATIVLYDDEAIPPAEAGYIEVCKDAARIGYHRDRFVTGPFTFTVRPSDGSTFDLTVEVGQCSAPVKVAAGIARVTERANPNHTLVDAFTIPHERLLDSNLINGTVDVEVPNSDDPNDETQVHFVNKRDRAQLKVCKALGRHSEVLDGQEFYFAVRLLGDIQDSLVPGTSIVANAGTTQCVIVDDFPVGGQVTVEEVFGAELGAADLRFDETGQYIDVSGEITSDDPLTIRPGINTVTITNTALGKLEICKFVTDAVTGNEAYHEFKFRIDGGAAIRVRPNRCSTPQLVSPGEHTVTEDPETNYELDPNAPGDGITVTPPGAETDRSLLGRSVTVNVPYAGDPAQLGKEVRVDYYNRIRRAQIKVCKHLDSGSVDSLGDKEFTFTVTVPGAQGSPFTISGVRNGECRLIAHSSGEVVSFPILNANGTPKHVTVAESDTTTDGWIVTSITVQGARSTPNVHCLNGNCAPAMTDFDLGPGTNTVHFTNKATDP
jgi:hypothetical protein